MTSSTTNDTIGTPTRSNYAEPHTPIASAKRPRNPRLSYNSSSSSSSSLPSTSEKGCSSSDNNNNDEVSLENVSGVGNTTPRRDVGSKQNHHHPNNNKLSPHSEGYGHNHNNNAMSPMHPPRRVPSLSHGNLDSDHNNGEQMLLIAEEEQQQQAEDRLCVDDSVDEVDATDLTPSSWGALFSPVLSFLNGTSDEDENNQDTNKDKQPSTLEDGSSEVLAQVTVDEEGDVHMNRHHHQVAEEVDDDNAMDHVCSLQNKFDEREPSTKQEEIVHEEYAQTAVELSSHHDHHHHHQQQEVTTHVSTDNRYGYHQTQEEVEEEDEEDEEEEFNPYLFIKSLPAYDFVVHDPYAKICLPVKDPADPPITLVLDLDETLVHCTVEPIPNADMIFPVVFHGIEYKVHVRCRPFLTQFLEAVYQNFEVVVFTASQQVYADELLNRIDPEGKYIKHRMFRESCLLVQGNYLKDLNVLGRNLKKAVLVDNSPHAFGYQVDNGIPIESWFDDPHDSELVKLEQFLQTLHGANDVSTLVRAKFQTYKLIRNA